METSAADELPKPEGFRNTFFAGLHTYVHSTFPDERKQLAGASCSCCSPIMKWEYATEEEHVNGKEHAGYTSTLNLLIEEL